MSLAQEALRACRLAYDAPNVWGGNGQARIDFDRERNSLAVAIAGTNGKRDVAQDAEFWKDDIGQGAEVHAGFLAHYRALWPAIDAKLASYGARSGSRILLTGHSLGAAVAVLLAWHRPYLFKGANVVLFGCPFVGNSNFAAMFEMLCRDNGIGVLRYVSRGDPVASFHLGQDWQHVGREVLVGEAGDLAPDHPLDAYAAALN